MDTIQYLNDVRKHKSVYQIALDIGVSEGTLLRYLKGAKIKAQTEQIIVEACKEIQK